MSTSLVLTVVLATMAWKERPVTAHQDLMENTVRSISMNVCQARAIMEVAVWTRIIASIAYVHQERGEAFANKVNNSILNESQL